jgi:anti-sigma factor RsiW
MNCKQTQKQISAYLDGELPARDADAVRGHIQNCAVCAEILKQDERLQTAYAAAMPSAPSNFTAQVMARIDREEAGGARVGGFSVWEWLTRPVAQFAIATAAIVCVGVAALLLMPTRPATEFANKVTEPVALKMTAQNLDHAAAVASAFAEGCDGRVISAAKGDGVLLLRIQIPKNRVADFRGSVSETSLSDTKVAQTELSKLAPARRDLAASLQGTNLGLPHNVIPSPLGIATVSIGSNGTAPETTAARNAPHQQKAPVEAGFVVVELEIRVSAQK